LRAKKSGPPPKVGPLQGSHDRIRTPLHTPLPIRGSLGLLSNELSMEKWPPREIHKYIVARSLLCDQPSGICRAARSGNSAHAKENCRNTTKRKSFRRPGLPHRMERRSEWKFGSWGGVFLLGNCSRKRSSRPATNKHGRKGPWRNCKRFKLPRGRAGLWR
jgi:hypothetical protein